MKLSVCVQTYNHEPYIAQALDSVLMQKTDFDFEILVGEDDSSDGTREICREYARRHPDRIRLFLNSRENVIWINGRPTGRWNFANNINHACGEYIALLDGDDYWTDDRKLQKQVEFLDSYASFSSCAHRVTRQFDDARTSDSLFPIPAPHTLELTDFMRGNQVPTCSTVLRRGCVTPLPDWIYAVPFADWCMHVMCAIQGKIELLPDVMGVYRIHASGAWSALSDCEKHESSIRQISQYLAAYRGRIPRAAKVAGNQRVAELYILIAAALQRAGCAVEAKTAIRRAIRTGAPSVCCSRRHIRVVGTILFPRIASAYRSVKTTVRRGTGPEQAE